MSAPSTVAITGLGTFLGQRVAERLATRAPRMRVVGVDLRRPQRLERKIAFERIDLTDPRSHVQLADLFVRERVESVVHAAFRRDPTPDVEDDHELEAVGSLHLLNACAAAKVPRLVLASSTMLYGPRPDNPLYLRESHPLRGHADAHCVRNRVEVETLFARHAAAHPDARVTVLRCAWMMGPTYTDRVVRHFSRALVPTVLGHDPLLNFVHEEDCLDVFEQAVLGDQRGVFNVVARDPLPLSTILRSAGLTSAPLPAGLLYRMRDLASRATTGDPPAAFYDYLRWPWTADGEDGWGQFGEPAYTTREAWIAFVSAKRLRQYR